MIHMRFDHENRGRFWVDVPGTVVPERVTRGLAEPGAHPSAGNALCASSSNS